MPFEAVFGLHPPARERHVARPWIVRVTGALDEENLGTALARANYHCDCGLALAFQLDPSRRMAPESEPDFIQRERSRRPSVPSHLNDDRQQPGYMLGSGDLQWSATSTSRSSSLETALAPLSDGCLPGALRR